MRSWWEIFLPAFIFLPSFNNFVMSARGALILRAEIILLEPDLDNAGEGRMATGTLAVNNSFYYVKQNNDSCFGFVADFSA